MLIDIECRQCTTKHTGYTSFSVHTQLVLKRAYTDYASESMYIDFLSYATIRAQREVVSLDTYSLAIDFYNFSRIEGNVRPKTVRHIVLVITPFLLGRDWPLI